MGRLKRIMRRPGPRAVACWITARYLGLLVRTGRWEVEGGDIPASLLANGRAFIIAFWHGRLLMVGRAWPYDDPFHMVISRHPDGQLIARTIAHLGFASIAGSTARGGAEVLRAMVRTLRGGACVGVTPDGPHGPRMRANPGIVHAARLAGVPIVPVSCAAAPCRMIASWDRLVVPFPFGRAAIAWGEPIAVARDADDDAVEAARLRLEDGLNRMTRALEARLGLEPVEPEALAAGGAA